MYFQLKKEIISTIIEATGEDFYVDDCIGFWLLPHIQKRLNQTGAEIEKSVMVEPNKKKKYGR